MRILHCADLHIREKDIEEVTKCLAFLVETARTEAVDLIVIAGDTFDSQDVKMGSQSARLAIETVSALADISPVAIIVGTSSHDGAAPMILGFARGKYEILVADKPTQVVFTEPKTCLTLIPQPTKQYFQTSAGIEASDNEIGQAMSGLFMGFGAQAAAYNCPHILVGHWNVNGCRLANGQIRTGMDIEVSVDQMNLGNFDLGLLGHIHIAQCLGGKYFYAGPVYATKIDEDGPKGFYVHEIKTTLAPDMGGKQGRYAVQRFIETPCKRTVRFKRDLTGEFVEPIYVDGVAGASVRLEITVWQDEDGTIDKEATKQAYMEAGALDVDLRIIRKPRVTVRSAEVLHATTLRDKIVAHAAAKGEDVEWSVLAKADLVEGVAAEELIQRVMAE